MRATKWKRLHRAVAVTATRSSAALEWSSVDLNLGYISPGAEREFLGVVIADRSTVGGHARFRVDPGAAERAALELLAKTSTARL